MIKNALKNMDLCELCKILSNEKSDFFLLIHISIKWLLI